MKLKIIAAFFALTLGAGLALTAPSTASADTKDGSPASCRGFESQIVPAGSSLNEPDGQQSFLAFVDSLIGRTVNGVLISTRGGFIALFAQLHPGVHSGCERALVIVPPR
jgi:hypothetical protein